MNLDNVKHRETEAVLRIACRMARLGGFCVHVPQRRVAWSDEVCAIHEVDAGTTLGVDEAVAYCAPEYRDLVETRVAACMHDGTPFDLEAEIITARNRRLWVRSVGNAERDANGAVVRIHGALQNIDDRRKLQEQFRHAQKVEALGRLAGGVAHDFNNLISVILSYASFVLEDLAPGSPVRADVEEIAAAGRRATELTGQLLAFSRQQASKPCVLDVAQVVLRMKKMLRRLLGEDIDLALCTSPGIGTVFADPSHIEQVLMNLVVNARDAMPCGGKLGIEVRDANGDVVVVVTDTGIGMDGATREHIFEPFFTTKEQGKGTGLGLSTVFDIITQCGGRIEVDSEPGRGTTFAVYLPRTERAVEPAISPPPVATLRGTETILVVEDEPLVRAMMCTILRRSGYRVLEAASCTDALAIAAHTAVHVLLTDVVMPQMSGRELADRLAPTCPDMRVLYMSGYAEDTIGQYGVLDTGAFVQKPITPDAILRKLRQILDAS